MDDKTRELLASDSGKNAAEFFIFFARFECALKAAGYLNDNTDGAKAKPNWDRLGQTIDLQLLSSSNEGVAQALEYFRNSPPKEQKVKSNRLVWEDVAVPDTMKDYLMCVVRVRNNLFHGGKFSDAWEGSQRNTELFKASVAILTAAMQQSNILQSAFEQAH